MTVWRYGAGAHIGRVRKHNEDYFLADPQAGLWLVADGMGGRKAGEVASAVVAKSILTAVRQGVPLVQAVAQAHQAVQDLLAAEQGAEGMGSTVVALNMQDNHYQIAWVGDSRAYLWGSQGLRQLTRDHTLVQALVEAGVISSQEARAHPQRSQLTQALGPTEVAAVKVETVSGQLAAGEQILLCSDGLTSELEDSQIAAILDKRLTVQNKVDALIQAALAAGGRDNITVLLIPAPGDQVAVTTQEMPAMADVDTQPMRAACAASPFSRWAGGGSWLLPLLIIGLAALSWWWQRRH